MSAVGKNLSCGKTAPNVSVIVPAYNCQDTIGKCIRALLRQSYPRKSYEIIVVDDGSTDKTAEKIQEHPVKYSYQSNQGPAAARNHGVALSRAPLILFTDSDCMADSCWIEQMVSSFSKPGVVGVKGAYGTRQTRLWARFAQVEFEERYRKLQSRENIDMVDTYCAGYRRDVFLNAGGFDPHFPVPNNEDTELSYKISLMGHKMVFNPEAIVYHTNHPDSLWKYFRLKFWRGYWRMEVYRRYITKMLRDSYTPQNLKFQILCLFFLLLSGLLFPLAPNFFTYMLIVFILAFLLSSVGFMIESAKKDLAVTLLSPCFLLVRALALGSGVFWWFFGRLFKRNV